MQKIREPFDMSSRFYSETEIHVGMSLELSDSESHHLIHVMRAKVGDELSLFNDTGFEFPATITVKTKKVVTVEILDQNEVNRELEFDMIVAAPLPKSDRQKFLIEKLTEVGVTEYIPVQTQRTSVSPNPKVLEKLSRLVVEASKQCGRNRLMKISNSETFSELCQGEAASNRFQDFEKLIAIPTTDKSTSIKIDAKKVVLIGPEGGFTPDEMELAANSNWGPVNLGKSILRMETAALAAAIRFGK